MKKFLVVLLAALMLAVGANAAFEKVNTYSNNFSDVNDGAWYANDVKTAYELGFMNGKDGGLFDPNGTVTVAEGITMASRLHATYNGKKVEDHVKAVEAYGFSFEDGKAPTAYNRATGKIEDGVLIVQADKPNASGAYDPQITFNKLSFSSTDYNKLKVRMRIDPLPNTNPEKRNEVLQFYFMTSVSSGITADKCVVVKLKELGVDLTQWFEFEVDLFGHEMWTDTITGFRFDPSDDNGIFYIDYINFEKSENAGGTKWYQQYVDYAVDNGIYAKNDFTASDMSRNITRAEMLNLIAASVPEEEFATINDIKGIPDVLRDAKNADVYLMLYKAGIVLGDTQGNLKPASDIKRSEISAIINRVALPENRVKGTTNVDWAEQGNEYDVEFNSAAELERAVPQICDSAEIVNGALVLKPTDRGEGKNPRYDPRILVSGINVPAEEYGKLKVRMKVDFLGETPDPKLTKFDFYFKTEGDEALSEAKSMHQAFTEYSYLDPAGWYVMEVDFSLHKEWKGNIVEFRFDPANTNGVYTIDYIRLAKGDPLQDASHDTLLAEGYAATRVFQDEYFERGFGVASVDQSEGYLNHGLWQDWCETGEKPLWGVGPWWIGTGEGFTTVDLWDDRDTTTDKYTLTDKYGINTVKYNPETKSITMRQNGQALYQGKPHDKETYKWWPHLLLEQSISLTGKVDTERNSIGDRSFLEIDIRMNDYKPTTNEEGYNVQSFLIYAYLVTDKAPGQRIWFGFQMFVGDDYIDTVTPGWSPDSAANQYMYGIRQNDIYDGMENTFNPEKGVVVADGEWKNVRMDITSHIKRAVEWANRDNIFGTEVSVEDMYWNGVNIGFETHGNTDYEFEFKNFNIVSYNKAD